MAIKIRLYNKYCAILQQGKALFFHFRPDGGAASSWNDAEIREDIVNN
jgi:hypothetical protein